MKKPTTVNIMGKVFEVAHPKQVASDKDVYGHTVGHDRKITIKGSLSGEAFEDTLLHETIHAILAVSGMTEMLSEEHEEAIVVALENGLSQLYKRDFE